MVTLTKEIVNGPSTDWFYQRASIKLPNGKKFNVWPHKDDWNCWSIGYGNLDEVIEVINYLLTIQEGSKA